MALDTATKRFAMLCATSPVGGMTVVPSGSDFSVINRFALFHVYGGLVDEVIVVPVIISSAGVIGSRIIGKDTM